MEILRQMKKVASLRRKKEAFHYVWKKIQVEVYRYWKDKDINKDKLRINEDNRLSIISFLLI